MKRRVWLLGIGVLVISVTTGALVFGRYAQHPWLQTPPSAWWPVAGQSKSLDVELMSGVNDCRVRASVVETESAVQVTGWIRCTDDRPHIALGVPTTVRVQLKAPLGDRRVIDQRGNLVPERIA